MEAAHFACRYDDQCRRFYDRKKQQTNPVIATKSLACKLAKAAWHVIKEDVPYDARAFSGRPRKVISGRPVVNQRRGLEPRANRTEWARLVSPQPKSPPRREWPKEKFMAIRPSRESATGWTRCRKAVRAPSHLLLNEPGLALNIF